MYLNGFSVRVVGGKEQNGYILMRHKQQYTLSLRNNHSVRCDARIEIDGKDIGTFRIPQNTNLVLERPAHDDGKFTFYQSGSYEFGASGLYDVDENDLGLIQVTFTPERKQKPLGVVDSGSSGSFRITDDHVYTRLGGNFDTENVTMNYAAAAAPTSGAKRSSAVASRTSGGTGLSGHSDQYFYNVSPLDYDYSKQTIIRVRLVLDESDVPRPLTSRETPIPPPV